MKKIFLKILVLCVAVCSALCVFTACGESPISFKLNFIVDNEIVKTIDTTGNEKIALPNDPQKDGYAFDGWFWDKDVWEKPFTANSLLDAPLSSDMSVYAKFTKNHEHNYTATVTAPTCTEKGYTTYTCACGESYKDDYVDELGHNYNAAITEPTCTEQGYTTHTCSRCKDSYIDTYINELEHEFTNYVSDNNATYDSDGTKTAHCNHGCGATDTVTDVGTKLQSGIAFKSLNVDKDLNVYGKVPNTQATFSFINEVEIKGNATFVVSTDIYGIQQIPTKTVPLEIGDNTFYITETVGNNIRLFTVTVRRRPIYTVSFNTDGGTTVASQQVEEDSPAIESTTTKAGYTLAGWDYDFTNPIADNIIINAKFTIDELELKKYEYTTSNNSYILTGIKDKNITEIILPDYFVGIDYNAFKGCILLTKVTIPESVTSIGGRAFYGCTALESITIPDTVTSIGGSAFYGCTALKSVVLPSGINRIETSIFYNCKNLSNVIIPESVTSIGNDAFRGCSSLINIEIPKNVSSIGRQAFLDSGLYNAVFKNPSGWQYTFERFNGTDTIYFTTGDIGNSSTAATYLRKYYSNDWVIG